MSLHPIHRNRYNLLGGYCTVPCQARKNEVCSHVISDNVSTSRPQKEIELTPKLPPHIPFHSTGLRGLSGRKDRREGRGTRRCFPIRNGSPRRCLCRRRRHDPAVAWTDRLGSREGELLAGLCRGGVCPGWVGLGWAALSRVGFFGWTTLGLVGLGWAELGWVGIYCSWGLCYW